MVVEINGIQHCFTGTADGQYEHWRELRRRFFKGVCGQPLRASLMRGVPWMA